MKVQRWNMTRLSSVVGSTCVLLSGCAGSEAPTAALPVESTEQDTTEAEASDGPEAKCTPQSISLDLPAFFPDSATVDARGRLYVGSVTTGAVMRMAPDRFEPELFAEPSGFATLGLSIDDANQRLWRCRLDLTFVTPSVLQVLDLGNGQVVAEHSLPEGSICNGVALDAALNAYATDSFGQTILRVRAEDAAGNTAAEVWATSSAEVPAGQFGLNGITFDGGSALFVSNLYEGSIYRVDIAADGSAGALELVDTEGQLSQPDGILWHSGALWVTEFASGELSRIVPSASMGRVFLVRSGLDTPTSVVATRIGAWVVESQVDHLFDQTLGAPTVPFQLAALPECL